MAPCFSFPTYLPPFLTCLFPSNLPLPFHTCLPLSLTCQISNSLISASCLHVTSFLLISLPSLPLFCPLIYLFSFMPVFHFPSPTRLSHLSHTCSYLHVSPFLLILLPFLPLFFPLIYLSYLSSTLPHLPVSLPSPTSNKAFHTRSSPSRWVGTSSSPCLASPGRGKRW